VENNTPLDYYNRVKCILLKNERQWMICVTLSVFGPLYSLSEGLTLPKTIRNINLVLKRRRLLNVEKHLIGTLRHGTCRKVLIREAESVCLYILNKALRIGFISFNLCSLDKGCSKFERFRLALFKNRR